MFPSVPSAGNPIIESYTALKRILAGKIKKKKE